MNPITPSHAALLRIGALAAFGVALLTPLEVVVFTLFPQPDTVAGWFRLFQDNPLVGLVSFWGLELPLYAMLVLVFLALHAVLKNASQSTMAIALSLVLLGAAVFFATNNPFSMLTLSGRYAGAATADQRTALIGAGEALLANTNQRAIGGFNLSLLLVSTAGLMVSFVMLHSGSFSKKVACFGIVAYALSLADYVRQALTSSVLIALLLILPGALLLVVWFSLVGSRLLRLGDSAQ
jgi:hypothetical protein